MKKVILISSIIIALLAAGAVLIYQLFFVSDEGVSRNKEKNRSTFFDDSDLNNEEIYEEIEVKLEPEEEEKYLSEIGEIQETYSLESSEKIMTEKDIMKMLSERGFNDCIVETEFSESGNYSPKEIRSDSSEKHPEYEMNFSTENWDIWNIRIVNGKMTAFLCSDELYDEEGTVVIISETEYITYYDCVNKQFIDSVPDKSEAVVKVVAEINAELLENLTVEEIRKL